MRTRSLALMFLPLLMSGCTVTVTTWTPPPGNDLGLYGDYDIDAPGDTIAESCEFAGIDWVQLVVTDASGGNEYVDPLLEEPCGETGSLDSVTPFLQDGTYGYYWRGLDADGYVVAESDWFVFDSSDADIDGFVYAGDVLLEPTYYDGDAILDITPSYETGLASPAFGTCAQAGASGDLFNWVLWDADPDLDPAAEALYEDQGEDYCWDWILIDDRPFDLLDLNTPYYLELLSVNVGWSTVCEVELLDWGYTAVTCPVYLE